MSGPAPDLRLYHTPRPIGITFGEGKLAAVPQEVSFTFALSNHLFLRCIAAGGSLKEYGRRLTERQDAEIAVYERAKADFEAAKKTKSEDDLVAYWEELNDRLRNLGVKLVPLK